MARSRVRRNRRRRGASTSRASSRSRRVVFQGPQTPRTARPSQDVVLFKPRGAFNRSLAAPGDLNSRNDPTTADGRFDGRFRSKRSRGASRRSRTGAIPALPALIAGYVDPWSVDADDVRYPDDYQGLSGTWSTVLEIPITTAPATGTFTDANMVAVVPAPGSALYLITPDPSNMIVQGIAGTPGTGVFAGQPNTFNWPNGILFTAAKDSLNAFGPGSGVINIDNPVTNISFLRSAFRAARLVSGGIRASTTLNFSTVSGVIHVAPIYVDTSDMSNAAPGQQNPANPTLTELANGWQVALPSNLSDIINLPGYCEYPFSSTEANEVVGLFRRYGQEALNFKPTSSAWGLDDHASGGLATRTGVSSMNGYGHYCLLVYVQGVLTSTGGATPAGTSIGQLEIKCHYECQPNPSSFALSLNTGVFGVFSAASGLCSQAPPSQPLLMAAADNLCAHVPPVRQVDDSGIEELGFVEEVVRLWSGATRIASSVVSAVSTVSTLLAAFAI